MLWKWILFTCLVSYFIEEAYGNRNSCGSDYSGDLFAKYQITCDGYPAMFECSRSDVIEILSAEYGRRSSTECPTISEEAKNTNCILPEAKNILSQRCNNRTECSFIPDDIFPDPCPGTKKYLETKYHCVKFIFGCPGELEGIGNKEVASIAVQPNPGSWTKDPLLGNDHVFFAPSADTVHEYSSWEDFIDGSYTKRYTLRKPKAPGSMVVYDKNLYYVKADSGNIVRYSLITMLRTGEVVLPVLESVDRKSSSISLAVDEKGLWVTFPGEGGFINIGKLDKDCLTVEKTWATILTQEDSLHTFFICGSLYSINPKTGLIDFSFNTNAKSGQETKTTNIPFNEDGVLGFRARNRKLKERSFLQYNSSSISYNPRDRLLYLWDERNANAIYYKLRFDTQIPSEGTSAPEGISPFTAEGSKTPSSSQTNDQFPSESPSRKPSKHSHVPKNSCASTTAHNTVWPTTRVGDVATIQCADGSGGLATWRCDFSSPFDEPRWNQEGPDVSRCITWLSDIEINYDKGYIDRSFAFESLKSALSRRRSEITGKWIDRTSKLIGSLLEDSTPPTKNDGKGIVEFISRIMSILLEQKDAWGELDEDRTKTTAGSLLVLFQKAAFLYSDAVSNAPGEYKDREILRIVSPAILGQIEVRDKSLRYLMRESKTTFPDEEFCKELIDRCGSNVIKVPDDVIMRQIGPGSSPTAMFAIYNGLEKYLSPHYEAGWKIDSSIISVVLRNQMFRTQAAKRLTVVLKHKTPASLPRRCMHWEHDNKGSGNWTGKHCTVAKSNDTHTECLCDAPSNFAVFVDKSRPEFLQRGIALDVICGIGVVISVVCLIGCFVTFTAFKNLQNDRNTILKNLCVCLLVVEATFLLGFNQMDSRLFCSFIAGILQYFLIAAFMWMAVAGMQLYIMLTELFEEESRAKWYYLAGYGIPSGVTGLSVAFGYARYGTEKGCFIDLRSEIIWGVAVPIIIILMINACPLFAAMYKIHKSTIAFADSAKIAIVRTYMKGAIILLCLVAGTWTVAMWVIHERTIVLGCIFCTLNIIQGGFFFAFHCLVQPEIRQEYSRAFERFPCCRKVAKESYVSNSMTFSKHYAPGRFAQTGTSTQTRHLTLASQGRRPWDAAVTLPKTVDSSPMLGFSSNGPGSRENSRLEHWPQRDQTQNFTIRRNYDRERYMEQEPMLLPSYETTQPVDFTPTAQDEIAYNRLQHHKHHSAYYPQESRFELESILPPARFRTGVPLPSNWHNPANTMAHGCAIRTNPNFGPANRHRVLLNHQRQLSTPENGPFYWELDPPFLRSQAQHFHEVKEARIDTNNPQPSSIIQRLKYEMTTISDSSTEFMPVLGYSSSDVPEGPASPVRMRESHTRTHKKKTLTDRDRDRQTSEDEGQGSSFEDQENANLSNQSNIAATRCARHDEKSIVSPRQMHGKLTVHDNRFRGTVNSDSDDPIATDCSGSSCSLSFGGKNNKWSNQEMLV